MRRIIRSAKARTRNYLTARKQRRQHRREVKQNSMLHAKRDRIALFIIGAPRSGTTLLYQTMIEYFDFGYISNAHAVEPGNIIEIEKTQNPRSKRGEAKYASSHGNTRAPWEPSEAGEYWYRFFPREPQQMTVEDATDERMRELAAAVRGFMKACDSSVIFKNVVNTLRIPVLRRAIPEARYIYIQRPLEENARSLLAGRIKRGDINEWWSAKPAGADEIMRTKNPAQQVVWQIKTMEQIAKKELSHCIENFYTAVDYRDICADPTRLMEQLDQWFRDSGMRVPPREGVTLPKRFEHRKGGVLDVEIEKQLSEAIAEYPKQEEFWSYFDRP